MNHKNIRSTEQYVTLQTMFNNTVVIFQNNADINQIHIQTRYYLKALELFKQNQDISLLIFALPGIIIREDIDSITDIYKQIKNIICTQWDQYYPNHLDYEDYLYLRLQDIRKLDKLSIMLSELIYLNKDEQININVIIKSNDDTLKILAKIRDDNLQRINTLINIILNCFNSINLFINKIMNIIDDEEIKNSYTENTITINLLNQILNCLQEYFDIKSSNVNPKIEKKDQSKINEVDNVNSQVQHIVKLVNSIQSSSDQHMLILGLKYIVRNFDINNKFMMTKMLNDVDYAKIVSIILEDHDNNKN
jgi:hypothetical protein